jgi:hypothetical protein
MDKEKIWQIGIIAIVVIAAYFLINKVLKEIGKKGDEKKVRETSIFGGAETLAELEKKVYKKYGKPKTQTEKKILMFKQFPNSNQYVQLRKDVWDAKSDWVLEADREDMAMGAINSLSSKLEIAYFAKFFQEYSARGLFPYIESFFSSTEMLRLNDIIQNKPDIL